MRWFWWAVAAVVLVGGGGAIVYSNTRGLRNNNPGNIRRSKDKWMGLAQYQTDTAFFQFDAPEYGIRAMAKVLLNYERLYQINTVRGLIQRWAPGHENPTDAYVSYVAKAADVEPDQRIAVGDKLTDIVRAIIYFENGIDPYPDGLIAIGVNMARA